MLSIIQKKRKQHGGYTSSGKDDNAKEALRALIAAGLGFLILVVCFLVISMLFFFLPLG